MAKLIINDKEIELPDGADIKDPCKENGIMFGCEDGKCGTCQIKVDEGMENLNEKNDSERDMTTGDDVRLACQCKIKQGTVKINDVDLF